MLPRLQAEERLKNITDGAAGFGALERREHSSLIRRLEEAAGLERPKPERANVAVLEAMGIGVGAPGEDCSDG